MGMDPEGHIFYGYCYIEEGDTLYKAEADRDYDSDEEGDDDESEWFDRVLLARGVPPVNWEHPGYPERWSFKDDPDPDAYDKAYAAWSEASGHKVWDEAEDALKAEAGSGRYGEAGTVQVGSHGYDGCHIPHVFLYDSRRRVEWAESLAFDPTDLVMEVDAGQYDEKLARFVEVSGINVDHAQGPGWFLVANYY